MDGPLRTLTATDTSAHSGVSFSIFEDFASAPPSIEPVMSLEAEASPRGVELLAGCEAMLSAELRAAVSFSTARQAGPCRNNVLAVASAAPSKHNDNNTLFIEDSNGLVHATFELNAEPVNQV
jgi:hypothetical protein